MTAPRIAVAVASLKLPLRRALERARLMQADGVQLQLGRDIDIAQMTQTACRQLLYELSERSLGLSSLFLELQRPLYELRGLDERLDCLKAALRLAWQLKCPAVSFRLGRLPSDENSAEYETVAAIANDLARQANHVGSMPSLILSGDAPDDVARLLQHVKDGPIGVTLDPGVSVTAGLDPTEVFRRLVDSVTHILLRDAVREMDGTVSEVPVGRGEVSWDELLAVLAEAEFTGWLTALRTQGEDIAGDLANCVVFARTVWRN